MTAVEENVCVEMGMCEWHEELSCVMLEVQEGQCNVMSVIRITLGWDGLWKVPV